MDPLFSLPRPPVHAAGPAHRAMDRFERGPGDRSDRSDRFDRSAADRGVDRGLDRRDANRGAERRDGAAHRAAGLRERTPAGRAEGAAGRERAEGARGAGRGERPAFGAALQEARAALETATEVEQELVSVVEETLSSLEVDTDADTLHAVGWPLTLLAAAQHAQGEQVDTQGLVAALEDADGAALLGDLGDVDAAALVGELDGADAEGLVAEAEAMLADLAAEAGLVDGEEVAVDDVVEADADTVAGDDAAAAAAEAADTDPDADLDPGADPDVDPDPGAAAGEGDPADAPAAAVTAGGAPATTTTDDALRVGPPRAARADARAAAHPQPPGQQIRTEPVPGAEMRGGTPVGEVQQTMEMPRAEAPRTPQLPAGVQRILEMVAQLERMPPPRQLVLDLGDLRLRVGMEDGQVKLTVLKGDDRAAEELLADARDALAEQGFDLSKEGDEQEADGSEQGDAPGRRRAGEPTPPRRRAADTGLRL